MELFADKYIVITGGAGFIGSAVIRVLNDRGIKNLIVVDQLGYTEKWKNLVGKEFVDCLHKDTLFTWLEGREREIGAFIHLGACSNTQEKNASYLLENNYRYSVRLAEYALQYGHRFIYASSASTYGDGSQGFSDAHDRLLLYTPLNMYGYSKHLFDLWLYRQGLLDRVVGLKYFNVFGPNEYHKGAMMSAIVKMMPDVLRTGEITLFASTEPDLYGDGEQVRDFIYVKDVAEMTIQFLYNQLGGIYNIGSGREHTWNQLARAVGAALALPITIRYVAMPPDLQGKYQNYTKADMQKTSLSHLIEPRYTLTGAVREYIVDYLQSGNRW